QSQASVEPKSADLVDTLGLDYDYYSVMHYGAKEQSKNAKYVMTAIDDPLNTKLIGMNARPWGLTALDIDKVNALYSCSPKCGPSISLGAEYGGFLPDKSFTASTFLDKDTRPSSGRLYANSSGWCPAASNSSDDYIEIDLGVLKNICSVATQGSPVFSAWVKEYTIQYFEDNVRWKKVTENSNEKVFIGNVDADSVVNKTLPSPIRTQYIRFYPQKKLGSPCMRVGVYGGGMWSIQD
ncbi:hypothetical protein QZH41_013363, partial [Actinostola sp. cb2023]